jgi:hypothetical protein
VRSRSNGSGPASPVAYINRAPTPDIDQRRPRGQSVDDRSVDQAGGGWRVRKHDDEMIQPVGERSEIRNGEHPFEWFR